MLPHVIVGKEDPGDIKQRYRSLREAAGTSVDAQTTIFRLGDDAATLTIPFHEGASAWLAEQ